MSAAKILAVVAHCDDEALGCGGTLARHAEEGDEVHVVFLADGVGSRGGFNAVEHDRREQAAGRALAALGVKHWQSLGLRDNALDSYPLLEIIQPLEAFLRTFPAEVIYTHHGGDLNIDHQLTHRAVLTACRPIPGQSVRNIFVSRFYPAPNGVAPRPYHSARIILSISVNNGHANWRHLKPIRWKCAIFPMPAA